MRRRRPPALDLLLLCAFLPASAAWADDPSPSSLPLAERPPIELGCAAGDELRVPELLARVAKAAGDLVVHCDLTRRVRLRFASPCERLTWLELEALLDAHDVTLIGSRPHPAGPVVLRAVHHENLIHGGCCNVRRRAVQLPVYVTHVIALPAARVREALALTANASLHEPTPCGWPVAAPGGERLLLVGTPAWLERRLQQLREHGLLPRPEAEHDEGRPARTRSGKLDEVTPVLVGLQAGARVPVHALLQRYADAHDDVLLIMDPQVQRLEARFLTPCASLSWRELESVLQEFAVAIVVSRPLAEGPTVLRAHYQMNSRHRCFGDDCPGCELAPGPLTAVIELPPVRLRSALALIRERSWVADERGSVLANAATGRLILCGPSEWIASRLAALAQHGFAGDPALPPSVTEPSPTPR